MINGELVNSNSSNMSASAGQASHLHKVNGLITDESSVQANNFKKQVTQNGEIVQDINQSSTNFSALPNSAPNQLTLVAPTVDSLVDKMDFGFHNRLTFGDPTMDSMINSMGFGFNNRLTLAAPTVNPLIDKIDTPLSEMTPPDGHGRFSLSSKSSHFHFSSSSVHNGDGTSSSKTAFSGASNEKNLLATSNGTVVGNSSTKNIDSVGVSSTDASGASVSINAIDASSSHMDFKNDSNSAGPPQIARSSNKLSAVQLANKDSNGNLSIASTVTVTPSNGSPSITTSSSSGENFLTNFFNKSE